MSEFANTLIEWHQTQGRHSLPWQQLNKSEPNVYHIWLSEIMLQQTQVATVIPYFYRFIERFPTIQSLAESPIDDVLANWSGLGYYARARNLHETAQRIMTEFNGKFPQDHAIICDLKGIGRSTASAICSFAFKQRHAILDGNVKRVFSRYLGIHDDIHSTKTIQDLWIIAYELLPNQHVDIYIQAQMDLGATICTPKNPTCLICPVRSSCYAFNHQCVDQLPIPKKSKTLPQKETIFYVFLHQETSETLLIKRPATGLWGGLYSFPEEIQNNKIIHKTSYEFDIQHTFTHFKLTIHTQCFVLSSDQFDAIANESTSYYRVNLDEVESMGIPVPVKKAIHQIKLLR